MPFILKLHPRIYWVETAEPVAAVKPIDTVSSISREISWGKDKRGLLGFPTLRGATVTFICLAIPSYSTQACIGLLLPRLKVLEGIELHRYNMVGIIAIEGGFIEKAEIWVGLSKPLDVISAIPSRVRSPELNPWNVNSWPPDVAAQHS
nr:hypothetical protein POPTR_T083000 [Ipomoea batatas]GMD01422.1 hypothetical protein POPTR_T083000 [Ipomoea batatas]